MIFLCNKKFYINIFESLLKVLKSVHILQTFWLFILYHIFLFCAINSNIVRVSMSTYTKELLLRHRKEQDKLKAVVGGAWVHPNIVFTSEVGNYYCRSFTNKKQKQILVDNDMPSISVHGIRHSNASLLIKNCYDVKAISEHLDHCNTEITSNIYVHIFKEYKAKMAESIEHDLL